MLTAAYYASLVLMLPGAALAIIAWLLRGTLGETLRGVGNIFSFLQKIDDLFPRDWGWQWGFGVLVFLFLTTVAGIIFVVVAGALDRYRPYGAAILCAIATVSLVTLMHSEGFKETELAWFCFAITPMSILASGFVLWKAWVRF